jgi:plasmid stabilization system protein ParE
MGKQEAAAAPARRRLREMTTVWPYILRYRVDQDRVVILRVRHGAQSDSEDA